MAKNNPYTLVFGKQPIQSIPRPVETQEVMDAFLNEPATQQIYMITGVRGCGKTVFMTEVANKLKEHDGWIFTFRHENDYRMAVSEYRQYLEEYVYEKIWSELSRGDRNLLYAVAKSETRKVKEIKEIMGVSNNQYTPYRDRMIKKMLLDGSEYGYLRITLPLFEDYVIRSYTDY